MGRSARRWLVLLTAAVVVLAVATAFRDVPAVGRALAGFDFRLLPAALGFGAVMHLLRFGRWHLYARRIAGDTLSGRDSLLIYGAGLGTHLTPGRAGEVVRFAFLRRATGTPIARSAPIILAERLMDAAGLLGLALPGAIVLGLGGRAAVPLLLAPLLLIPLAISQRAHRAATGLCERVPGVRRFTHAVEAAAIELRGLMTPRLLVAALALSLAAMALEIGSFAVVLDGMGVALNAETYWRAAFILPTAMLASAIFLVPGNLGVAEGGMAALTRATLSTPAATAAGAAVLVRLCTLWLGLAVGAVALALATQRWGRAAAPAEPDQLVPNPIPGEARA